MIPCAFCSVVLFALMMQQVPGQAPPWTPNPNAQGPQAQADHRFPVDQPQQASTRGKPRSIDMATVKRDANELAKIADQIPSLVEQANKGVLSKDLNERLKRIEKLSKQLRRELTP